MSVTVVIPTRGRERLLGRAVGSCEAAAAGLPGLEIVVAVDGEPAPYASDLEGMAPSLIVLRSERPRGRGHARNVGLERAGGRYVKFLDDDDWLEPGALAEEVALAESKGADIVVSGHLTAGEGVEARYWPPPALDNGIDSILRGEAVPTAAALYRRQAIGDVRWDSGHSKLDDWHFFVRVALRASVLARLDRPTYTWYAHPGQGIHRMSMLDNAREFYWVLDTVEREISETGRLTIERCKRLAQYRYKELRVLCRYDRPAFELEVRRIRALDPGFRPIDEEPRAYLRLLARPLGFRRAVLVHEALRRAVRVARWRQESATAA